MTKFLVNLFFSLSLLIVYSYAADPLEKESPQTRARAATLAADDTIPGMTGEVKEAVKKLTCLAEEQNLQEGLMGRAASSSVNLSRTIRDKQAFAAFLLLETMTEVIGDLEAQEADCVATIKAAIGPNGRQTLLANHPEFSSTVRVLLESR